MIIFIRQLAVYVCVAILVVYAWRDWFKSLCGLILLTAVMGRLDFPQSLGHAEKYQSLIGALAGCDIG